jgi:hypothetical protein
MSPRKIKRLEFLSHVSLVTSDCLAKSLGEPKSNLERALRRDAEAGHVGFATALVRRRDLPDKPFAVIRPGTGLTSEVLAAANAIRTDWTHTPIESEKVYFLQKSGADMLGVSQPPTARLSEESHHLRVTQYFAKHIWPYPTRVERWELESGYQTDGSRPDARLSATSTQSAQFVEIVGQYAKSKITALCSFSTLNNTTIALW